MSSRKIVLAVAAFLVIFAVVFLYNRAQQKGAETFIRNTQARIDAAETEISRLHEEQAELAKAIASSSALLLLKQREYEARIANEQDEKLRSVWSGYRTGFILNRRMTLDIGDSLADLRAATKAVEIGGMKSLKVVQSIVSLVAAGISDSTRKAELLATTLKQQDDLEAANREAIQFVAHAKNEISSKSASLKDQERKIQALVPAGASRRNPVTDEIFKSLETALKGNQSAQELLARLEKATSEFGKLVLAEQSISKAQSEFLKAMR